MQTDGQIWKSRQSLVPICKRSYKCESISFLLIMHSELINFILRNSKWSVNISHTFTNLLSVLL